MKLKTSEDHQQIGELSRSLGVTTRTLRLYEQMGLTPPTTHEELLANVAAVHNEPDIYGFIVTNQAFGTSSRAATNEQAEAWLSGGLDRLPRSIQALPFDADVEASALVYQFRKSGHGDPPVALASSNASAATQLDRSGIVAALRR